MAIESPAEGATFIEGETIPIRAAATDDVAVVSVTFLVDGTTAFTDTSAPYQFSVTAPTGVGTLTVAANALDLGANVGTALAHVNVIPDPGTTVIGRVVGRDNQPLGGVHVSVLGRSGTTGVDGTFSVSGVPTLRPTITVAATLSSNGTVLAGGSAATPPVRDGTTDVGRQWQDAGPTSSAR